MRIITKAQLENHLEDCLEEAKCGEILVIAENGKEICEIHPRIESKLAVFDSLTGIASGIDATDARNERVLG